MPKRRPEEALQRACWDLLTKACPGPEEGGPLAWATPNQRGTRKGWEQGILTAMGMVNGVPDLLMLYHGRLIGFELKSGKGRVTDAQAAFHKRMTLAGGVVFITRSADEFIGQLDTLGIPCRAKSWGKVA